MKINQQLIEAIKNNDPTIKSSIFIELDADDSDDILFDQFLTALKHNQSILGVTITENKNTETRILKLIEAMKENTHIVAVQFKLFGISRAMYPEFDKFEIKQKRIDDMVKEVLRTNKNNMQSAHTLEWQHYLSQSYALAKFWESDQEVYAKLCYEAEVAALFYLNSKGDQITANELYEFTANRRHEIACILNQGMFEVIGKNRTNGMETNLYVDTGSYKQFFPILYNKFEEYLLKAKKGESKGYVCDTFIEYQQDIERITIKEDDIILSTISRTEYNKNELTILHTPPTEFSKINQKIDPLFQSVIKSKNATLEVLENIARIIWYYSHAAELERGSAATNEIFMRILMNKAGFPHVPYNHLISIDLIAIFEPDREEFVKKFASLFPKLGFTKNIIPLVDIIKLALSLLAKNFDRDILQKTWNKLDASIKSEIAYVRLTKLIKTYDDSKSKLTDYIDKLNEEAKRLDNQYQTEHSDEKKSSGELKAPGHDPRTKLIEQKIKIIKATIKQCWNDLSPLLQQVCTNQCDITDEIFNSTLKIIGDDIGSAITFTESDLKILKPQEDTVAGFFTRLLVKPVNEIENLTNNAKNAIDIILGDAMQTTASNPTSTASTAPITNSTSTPTQLFAPDPPKRSVSVIARQRVITYIAKLQEIGHDQSLSISTKQENAMKEYERIIGKTSLTKEAADIFKTKLTQMLQKPDLSYLLAKDITTSSSSSLYRPHIISYSDIETAPILQEIVKKINNSVVEIKPENQ